jgi:hypothetical protein
MGRPKGSKNKVKKGAGKKTATKALKGRAKAPRQRTAAYGRKKGGFLASLTRERDAAGVPIIEKDVNGMESYKLAETPGVIADVIPSVLAAIRPKNVNMVAILTDVKGRRALFSSSTGDKTDDRVLAAAGVFLRMFPRETLDQVMGQIDAAEAAAEAAITSKAAAKQAKKAVAVKPEVKAAEVKAAAPAVAAPVAETVASPVAPAAPVDPATQAALNELETAA